MDKVCLLVVLFALCACRAKIRVVIEIRTK